MRESHGGAHTGHDFLTLAVLPECVEWVCAEAAQWMRMRFRYAEAGRILDAVKTTGVSL